MSELDTPVNMLDLALESTDTESVLYSRYSELSDLERFLLEENDYEALRLWLKQFNTSDNIRSADNIVSALQREIARIDELISEQLNQILHHARFQKLEAAWRGLWYLVKQYSEHDNVKIKVLSISWKELCKDIGKAIEFDQSQLFKKIYSDEFGTPGGEPFGVLIGDYEISYRPSQGSNYDDISILEGVSQIAAASFAPFITSVASEFFGLDEFDSLAMPQSFEQIFAQTEYTRWRALRDKPDSRFVGLTLPRILMRKPYAVQNKAMGGFIFRENVGGPGKENYLWGNSCYAFASILIREFINVGWFGHIRGVPRGYLGGGLVNDLTVTEFGTDAPGVAPKLLTDVLISDRVERRLSDQGFIPLCHCFETSLAAFYSNQSVQKPKAMKTNLDNTNARLSTMLQHIMCCSRIAHYLKVIIRDKLGSFLSARECEAYLQKWINHYTTGRDDLEWSEQARYPLREANVQVKSQPGKPGIYMCIMRLKPHYQLDDMVSELELVTELAPV